MTLSLAAYAAKKHLDPGKLAAWGVSDGLFIGYRNEQGETVAIRKRPDWTEFYWEPRAEGKPLELVPYGVWLPLPDRGDIIFVEGESDAHSLWHHGIAALGVPGASMWRDEWRRYDGDLRRVVVKEPDEGGATFARILADSFGGVWIAEMTPYKDASEAHIALGPEFPAFFTRKAKEARYMERPSPIKKAPRVHIDGDYGSELLKLAGQYTELREMRADDWFGTCPFHSEKTPSFHVDSKRGLFQCFGCEAHGGLKDFKERIGTSDVG